MDNLLVYKLCRPAKTSRLKRRLWGCMNLLIRFPSSKQGKHSVPDKGFLAGGETEFSERWAASIRGRSPKKGGVPASASSFCNSLLALRGKVEVLSLFSLFTAEWEPGCFTLISWVAGGPVLLEPCRGKKKRLWWCRRQSKLQDNRCAQVSAWSRWEFVVDGSSSLPNQIEWFLARQPDKSQRCVCWICWHGFGQIPEDRIIEQMALLELSIGPKQQDPSSQSMSLRSLLDSDLYLFIWVRYEWDRNNMVWNSRQAGGNFNANVLAENEVIRFYFTGMDEFSEAL